MTILLKPAQVRAACGLIDWTATDLAAKIGVSKQMMSAYMSGKSGLSASNLEKIALALEGEGVEFTEEDGIKRSSLKTKTHRGKSGFIDFIWDVHETVKKSSEDICVSNVDEKDFLFWLGEEEAQKYKDAMAKLEKNFFFKILIREGDDYFAAGKYAEYRWVPKNEFSNVPFYVYGDKLAILLFDKEVSVYVLSNKMIADAYRAQFSVLWDRAIKPNIPGQLS